MTTARPVRSTRLGRLAPLLVGLLALLAILGACTKAGSGPPTIVRTTPAATTARFADTPPGDWTGGTVALAALPPEGREALRLVAAGGPYPYRQDDGVFGNREGVLPPRSNGSYREYTVVTPGSADRGARRLVVDSGRWVYYSDDHYLTFRFVTP